MMPIFSISKHARPARQHALACDIAARCATAIVQRAGVKTTTMASAELHGYVRARALPMVRNAMQQAIAEQHMPPDQAADLLAAALARTVQLVVRELQSPPVISVPPPHVTLRSAA